MPKEALWLAIPEQKHFMVAESKKVSGSSFSDKRLNGFSELLHNQ